MPSLLVTLRDILLLRRGPQDLPYSPILLLIVAAADLALQQWATALLPVEHDQPARVVVEVALYLGLFYLLLHALQRQARFVQAATASVCVDALTNALVLPLLSLMEPALRASAQPGATPETVAGAMNGGVALASLLFIAIVVWRLVVNVHILRQTLEIRLFAALLAHLALLFASTVIVAALFGVAPRN